MAKFIVAVQVTRTFEVEAGDEDEAIDIIEEHLDDGHPGDDFVETTNAYDTKVWVIAR
jgi:predicted small metal-binding protein